MTTHKANGRLESIPFEALRRGIDATKARLAYDELQRRVAEAMRDD